MSNYDLYRVLGLSSDASTSQLADELNRRLSDTGPRTQAQTEELSLALAVLGNDQRRALYDRRLNDPSAPDVTVSALQQLAATQPSVATHENTSPRPKRRRWLLPATALAVAAILIAAGVLWVVNRPTDDNVTATDNERTFTPAHTSGTSSNSSSMSSTGSDTTRRSGTTSTSSRTSSSSTSSSSPLVNRTTITAPSESPDSVDRTTMAQHDPPSWMGEIDTRGWKGDKGVRCNNSSDPWIFAAGTKESDLILVCQIRDTDRLYYKGYFNGAGLEEIDIDMSRTGPNKYQTQSDRNTFREIYVNRMSTKVTSNNKTTGEVEFAWSDYNIDGNYFK